MNEMEEIRQRTADRRAKIACALIKNGFCQRNEIFEEGFQRDFAEAVKNIERKLDS